MEKPFVKENFIKKKKRRNQQLSLNSHLLSSSGRGMVEVERTILWKKNKIQICKSQP
jgi:hypothetical protein